MAVKFHCCVAARAEMFMGGDLVLTGASIEAVALFTSRETVGRAAGRRC